MLRRKIPGDPRPLAIVAAERHAMDAHECLDEANRHVRDAFPSRDPDWEAVDRALNKATAHALTSLALRGGYRP